MWSASVDLPLAGGPVMCTTMGRDRLLIHTQICRGSLEKLINLNLKLAMNDAELLAKFVSVWGRYGRKWKLVEEFGATVMILTASGSILYGRLQAESDERIIFWGRDGDEITRVDFPLHPDADQSAVYVYTSTDGNLNDLDDFEWSLCEIIPVDLVTVNAK
jgi:hypothetical protein